VDGISIRQLVVLNPVLVCQLLSCKDQALSIYSQTFQFLDLLFHGPYRLRVVHLQGKALAGQGLHCHFNRGPRDQVQMSLPRSQEPRSEEMMVKMMMMMTMMMMRMLTVMMMMMMKTKVMMIPNRQRWSLSYVCDRCSM
jgi:hypothetical protein